MRACALEGDETLLVQSGKPVGVFRTHADAPRVLIANSNLVPRWADWEHFNALDRAGLMMYGQMTAGSWIYIGSQGIVQGTYETFVAAGRRHYGGDLSGRWILTAGLGGMGGAQPLAATIAGASLLAVECDPARIRKRIETRYLDETAHDLDDALARIRAACEARKPLSVGLRGVVLAAREGGAGKEERNTRRGGRAPGARNRPEGSGSMRKRSDRPMLVVVGTASEAESTIVVGRIQFARRGTAVATETPGRRQRAVAPPIPRAVDWWRSIGVVRSGRPVRRSNQRGGRSLVRHARKLAPTARYILIHPDSSHRGKT